MSQRNVFSTALKSQQIVITLKDPEHREHGVVDSHGSTFALQLSLVRGVLPMFELVERQPSHFSNPDVLNLTPGEAMQEGRAKGEAFPFLEIGWNCTVTSNMFLFCLELDLELLGQLIQFFGFQLVVCRSHSISGQF